MQRVEIVRERVRRESAIADHFGRHALVGLGPMVLQNLQIRVAVDVDESRRRDQTRAVEDLRLGRLNRAESRDNTVRDEQVAQTRRRQRTVNERGMAKENQAPILLKQRRPGQIEATLFSIRRPADRMS